jgi:hypothetical protein
MALRGGWIRLSPEFKRLERRVRAILAILGVACIVIGWRLPVELTPILFGVVLLLWPVFEPELLKEVIEAYLLDREERSRSVSLQPTEPATQTPPTRVAVVATPVASGEIPPSRFAPAPAPSQPAPAEPPRPPPAAPTATSPRWLDLPEEGPPQREAPKGPESTSRIAPQKVARALETLLEVPDPTSLREPSYRAARSNSAQVLLAAVRELEDASNREELPFADCPWCGLVALTAPFAAKHLAVCPRHPGVVRLRVLRRCLSLAQPVAGDVSLRSDAQSTLDQLDRYLATVPPRPAGFRGTLPTGMELRGCARFLEDPASPVLGPPTGDRVGELIHVVEA